jgi:hypothetical protein
MLEESTVLETSEASDASSEKWRRFIGRQLMLLAELMIFCVPAFFVDNAATIDPLGKRKARGAVRTDMNLNKQSFVPTRAKVDTAAVRNWAMQYARVARVSDVQCDSADTGLFVDAAGLALPLAHDEKTVLMLKEPTLTPTGSLLSFCSDVIMQVQCAYALCHWVGSLQYVACWCPRRKLRWTALELHESTPALMRTLPVQV